MGEFWFWRSAHLTNFTVDVIRVGLEPERPLYKLHPSIPFKVEPPPERKRKMEEKEVEEEAADPGRDTEREPPVPFPEEDPHLLDANQEVFAGRDTPFYLPAGSKKRWTEEETDLIALVGRLGVAYNVYIKRCIARRIPVRTLLAFKQKRIALMAAMGRNPLED